MKLQYLAIKELQMFMLPQKQRPKETECFSKLSTALETSTKQVSSTLTL
jgi:hypothetical protein